MNKAGHRLAPTMVGGEVVAALPRERHGTPCPYDSFVFFKRTPASSSGARRGLALPTDREALINAGGRIGRSPQPRHPIDQPFAILFDEDDQR